MRRRRRWIRRIGRSIATVGVGLTLGFLVPTIVADYSPDTARPEEELIATQVNESPVARQFIDAYAADDQTRLDALGVAADVKLRAARNRSDYARVDQPVHLGSYVGAGFSLHAYASHVIKKDGTVDMIGWRVVTGGGEVAVINPPVPVTHP